MGRKAKPNSKSQQQEIGTNLQNDAFPGPLSVAEQRWFCQGKMHMDVHFSFDKPGWRIKTALKQSHCCEGSRRPTRPGCIFLVTSFVQAKEVTRPQAKKGFSVHKYILETNTNIKMDTGLRRYDKHYGCI